MPRCKKHRCCRQLNHNHIFKPIGIPLTEINHIRIELDEFEAMRLCDFDGHDQIEAGEKMNVSRGTIQRLLKSGRRKIIEAILTNSALIINDTYNSSTCQTKISEENL